MSLKIKIQPDGSCYIFCQKLLPKREPQVCANDQVFILNIQVIS